MSQLLDLFGKLGFQAHFDNFISAKLRDNKNFGLFRSLFISIYVQPLLPPLGRQHLTLFNFFVFTILLFFLGVPGTILFKKTNYIQHQLVYKLEYTNDQNFTTEFSMSLTFVTFYFEYDLIFEGLELLFALSLYQATFQQCFL